MRKGICLLCLTVFLAGVMPMTAAAETSGSIQFRLDTAELPVINGAVTLYQVGSKVEEGYRITEGFGGGIVRQEDADSEKLAQWLAETAAESGDTMLLDADGNAVYADLNEGLYMLVQTERTDGFYPIHPVLLTIPDGSRWDVQVYRKPVPIVTEIPRTGQSPIPFFGILGMILSTLGLMICAGKSRNPRK